MNVPSEGEWGFDTVGDLCECASEVDVDFVRKIIKAIGRLLSRLSLLLSGVGALMDLINAHVSYVVQEAVVVVRDTFRKYPTPEKGAIPTLWANLQELDEPEAKASLIWIIGKILTTPKNSSGFSSIHS